VLATDNFCDPQTTAGNMSCKAGDGRRCFGWGYRRAAGGSPKLDTTPLAQAAPRRFWLMRMFHHDATLARLPLCRGSHHFKKRNPNRYCNYRQQAVQCRLRENVCPVLVNALSSRPIQDKIVLKRSAQNR